jgi:threonine dehydratase
LTNFRLALFVVERALTNEITLADVLDAQSRIDGVIRRTPTRLADSVSRALGRPVYLKPEHLQRAGSFKIRGAYNRISRLDPGVNVVAASAGNHAQGVALASSLTGRRSVIFMPDSASLPKLKATEGYGAEVIIGGPTLDDCLVLAREYATEHDAVFVPPFNDRHIIAGQATVGLEIADDYNDDAAPVVLIPVGGGGLVAGAAFALRERMPNATIIGVEAEGAASMRRSLDADRIVTLDATSTMADGIALKAPGDITFAMTRDLVDDVITVTEDEIAEAVLFLMERAKAVVEPSGAVGVAALLAGRVAGSQPAVVVLSGGNVDPMLLTSIVTRGLSAAGRYLRLRIVFRDRPGSLAALTAVVARLGLNVLDVEHHRTGVQIGVDQVEVLMVVETRNPEHRNDVIDTLRAEGFEATLL